MIRIASQTSLKCLYQDPSVCNTAERVGLSAITPFQKGIFISGENISTETFSAVLLQKDWS